MSFETPISIADALNNIERRRYLLPAIQREFVWPASKIEWLFDSLMRGYPISSFLFWNVEDLSRSGYKFYEFLRNYRERFKIHNAEADVNGISNFIAVLDGQQRLTSLNIGLRGSFAWKEYKAHWNDNENSIPTRRLYLNITNELKDQEDDRVYQFQFLKDADTSQTDIYDDGTVKWFRVSKINDLRNFSDFSRYVGTKGFDDFAKDVLAKLQEVVFTKPTINFFLEREQNLDKALNIFIRINSGGEPLNFSDLIMSIAIANWQEKDARQEIHRLADGIRAVGFSISKDFIFKTYLYLFSSDIKFKVTNFSKENAHNFERDWDSIRDTIQIAFELIRSFGYDDYTLSSKNAVIPVIYYLYHRGNASDFNASVRHKADRERIKKWLHVTLLKRVFGAGGADGTLAQIRRAFTEDVTVRAINPSIDSFPVTAINAEIKRDTSVGDEFIEELLKTQKDGRYAFCILALLYPQLDYRNNDFHKDHLHPITAFSRKAIEALGLDDGDEAKARFLSPEWYNSIINLQMLDSNENKSKQDKSLEEWVSVETQSKDRTAFLDRQLIPHDVSLSFRDFGSFAMKRRTNLAQRLAEAMR